MTSKFMIHERVHVRSEKPDATKRTPRYVRGKTGTVIETHGVVSGYEVDHRDDWGPLYSVLFDLSELFGHSLNERIVVDLHESWLEKADQ